MLSKYDPYKSYLKRDELLAPFDALISDFLNHSGFKNIPKEFMVKGAYPKCNVYEQNKNTLCIEAGVPGLTKEDINIQVVENVLSINFKSIAKKKDYIIRELKQSSSTRSFFLNEDLDIDSIKATVSNGLLTITIPRKTQQPQDLRTKTIKIN